ncbi:MAG: hypothetical protein KDD82_04500 [Planctomycetes bacterium]|nr:hypothetical protein [Planctomycetota bacterium]
MIQRHARNVAPLLAVSGPPALGVAVRVNATHAFFAIAVEAEGPSRTLTQGEVSLPAKPIGAPGAQLLAVERDGSDYRPCLSTPPPKGGRLVALSGGAGAISAWEFNAGEAPPVGRVLTVSAPVWLPLTSAGEEEVVEPGPELSGSPVFTEGGAWVGFLERRDVGWAVRLPQLDALREAALTRGGGDVLLPTDPGWLLTLRVTEVSAMPTVEDEWGDPDFYLRVRARGRALDPVPLDAEQHRVRLPLGTEALEVELVERDVSLTAGDHSQRVAGPVPLIPFGFSQALVLATPEGEAVVLKCEARYADPDRASSDDRTPLGARDLPMRRVVSDSVSEAEGDATDLWRFDAPSSAPYLAVLLRRESEGAIDISLHSPSVDQTYLRGRLGAGRHLRILPTIAPLVPGPVLLRVRQLDGERPTHYSLMVARRDDPLSLIRTLFRLIAREAVHQPYLDTREFAREVYEALALDAKLERADVASAVLAELGHRSRAGRHLALRLLERTFRPDDEALRNVYTGSDGVRSLDSGILLALRHPNDSSYINVIELAARDPDPLVRLLGLAVASAFTTEERRATLRAFFADDPSPQIQRVFARTR